MISLDWKERLKKDTIDFYERKLPNQDYDIDIVYNAYPERVDNKVPAPVITLVGKTLASKLAKDADKYFPFYDYLLSHKGESGMMIFVYIMARAIKRHPDTFFDYLEKVLFSLQDQKTCNLIFDKAIYPYLKEHPEKYLDTLLSWLKRDNLYVAKGLQKIFTKLINYKPELIKPIFHKLETSWLYATPRMIKFNTQFIKAIYTVDPDYYLSIYNTYKSTRNPLFAEILCNAIVCYDKTIESMVDTWSQSGNVKLKKIGLHGQKIIKRRKK